ncbi:hypothetical protein PSEUBRA_000919 [Kalmanozyma brasiliensis GHG001]|uniref:Uncharacterized protein n=1 Tax=Kalmanozyma brasiliensis (strain GHG001) TaxID=1365824 RepID=V5EFN7_KALBG|nr:uncharacterized protein PSEUBRA_000919 [Kalmanozyma brasiliensis GHG001]EST09326.1 hypothetical protein PSEUBRA_000919 [Kalmanozyma brasiliensis GHG001]
MDNDSTPPRPSRQAEQADPSQDAGSSAFADLPSPNARQSRIRSVASESWAPINFARPITLRPDSVEPPADAQAAASNRSSYIAQGMTSGSEDTEWHDADDDSTSPPMSPWERRTASSSSQHDRFRPSTPLKNRRKGMINDKKLTIDTSSSKAGSSRRAASESSAPAPASTEPAQLPARPPRAMRKLSDRLMKVATSASPTGSGKKDSPVDSLAPPPSAGIRWAPFTPTKRSPLGEKGRSPVAASTSPASGSATVSSSGSDKTAVAVPRYGFNPDFQLGGKTEPGASPRSGKGTSPTKPSPTYAGLAQGGGVKSMLYANTASPSTPLSPRAPVPAASPRTMNAPGTPRTPLNTRFTNSPTSYQGVLLTTITRTDSDDKHLAVPGAPGTPIRGRNRSASVAGGIKGFVRGGAAEVIPRLEMRVLERPRRGSQFYGLGGARPSDPSKRHSLATEQPVMMGKTDSATEAPQDASPRVRDFARSAALDKLTSDSTGRVRSQSNSRRASAASPRMRMSFSFARRERRNTAGTTASGVSRRSERSQRSNRSVAHKRKSLPIAGPGSIKSKPPSLLERRVSLAPPSMRRQDSSMQPDSDESEDENDVINEMHTRVTNIQEAKRWILTHRPSMDANAPPTFVDEHRPVLAMRRPTYAASVFQQARLMEAELQADAALHSTNALNVSAIGSNFHIAGLPPKTPMTARPGTIYDVQDPTDLPRPGTALAVVPQPRTWQQSTLHYLGAPFRLVQRQIDPKYVLTMMDPREIIFPLSLKKVALWIIYGGVIAMLYLLDRYYHWWGKLDHAVHGKNFYIMGVLYGFEPVMILIIMCVARVPDARKVPDRTVLVPRGRDSTELPSEDEESESSSDDESVASEQVATQVHSTILEEEPEEQEENEVDSEMQNKDDGTKRNSKRLSGLHPPAMRRMSTRVTTSSGGLLSVPPERRGSAATSGSGNLAVPRTPAFDPRNRRSTIILHEPLNVDSIGAQLERVGRPSADWLRRPSADYRRPSVISQRRPSDNSQRRPSATSHQIMLARTASKESHKSSYFTSVAAAAGARPGTTTPGPNQEVVDEKPDTTVVVAAPQSDSSGELDEKKDVSELEKPEDTRIAMGSITHPSFTESTALIIPCHNADVEVLKAVLFAALVHFEPWQIFIIDNGNSPQPPTDMEAQIRTQPMFARVNYVWSPLGNKNIAQFVGAKAAAVLNLDYVLTIDDDVIIPANFAAPMHIINETTTAVCYPITAVDHKGDRPTFVGWQDIEYKLSALAKMAEAKMCGVLFPHGAASFWRRDTMIRVLYRHDLVYFADDVKMGLELQALGEFMGIDASISFETVAPETFLGPKTAGTPNYYNQRVRSWEMARHTLYYQFTKRFLFSLNGARGPVAIGWQKFTQFYNTTTNFIDWIRLPMFILLGGSGMFWLKSFAFILFLPILPLIPYRFIKTRNRPDLHPHLMDMLTYGIYKLLYSIVCIFGGIRSMLVFHPNHKHKPTLTEMEAAKDERCIWMREDFMQQSGGQGDLRDEPQMIMLDDEAELEREEQQEEAEQGAEMTEAALVNTLPENGEKGGEAASINVLRRPSTRISHELPTVHEGR